MYLKFVKLFTRLAIATGFLSAVADRFGLWTYGLVWGKWENFVDYTQSILPWFGPKVVSLLAAVATLAEVVLALLLIIGWKVAMCAKLSGLLMLLFALAMTFSGGIKTAFDASVFAAAAAAFALSTIKLKFLEID